MGIFCLFISPFSIEFMLSQNTSVAITSDSPSLEDFQEFLKGLLVKLRSESQSKSLKIADLATEFGYSLEEIGDFLTVIKMNFELYQCLNLQSSSSKSTNNIQIKISVKQLQILSDFHYITHQFPLRSCNKHPEIQKFIETFPSLVSKKNSGFITSPLGNAIAQQALAFKRLNSFPKSIQVDNHEILIQSDEVA